MYVLKKKMSEKLDQRIWINLLFIPKTVEEQKTFGICQGGKKGAGWGEEEEEE